MLEYISRHACVYNQIHILTYMHVAVIDFHKYAILHMYVHICRQKITGTKRKGGMRAAGDSAKVPEAQLVCEKRVPLASVV